MAQEAPAVQLKRFYEFLGVDKRSSHHARPQGFCLEMVNMIYTKQNEMGKRPGYKAIAASGGGHGLFPFSQFNKTTGAMSTRLLAISSTVQELKNDTITIDYSGGSECLVSVIYDDTNSVWKVQITEGSSQVLDFDCGKGYDESTSGKLLSDLKTAIDLVANFSSTISGDATVPAAFLEMEINKFFNSSTDAVLTAHHLADVNAVLTNMLDWFETNKNSDDFINCKPIAWRGSAYFPNPGAMGMLKFDTQLLYRAGLPKPDDPVLTEVAATAAAAEAVDVVCRSNDAVAEVFDITAIADDQGVVEISTVDCLDGDPDEYVARHFVIYDEDGSVAVWFGYSGTSEPSHGEDRAIKVTLVSSGETIATISEKLKDAMDADSKFSATWDSVSKVTITDADVGIRPNIEIGTMSSWFGDPVSVAVAQNGTSGLSKTYFKAYAGSTSIACWMNPGGESAPSHTCDRAIEIAYTSSGSADTIAGEIQTAMHADSDYSATVSSAVVTCTRVATGEQNEAVDSVNAPTGFAFARTIKGLDTLDGKYFGIYGAADEDVAVWYDGTGSTSEPSHGKTRSIKVTISAADAASVVATKTQTDVGADSDYSVSIPVAGTARILNATTGGRTPPEAGTTDFTMSVQTEGVDGGLGAGTFKYRLRFRQIDANGFITEGNHTEDFSITIVGSKDTSILFPGVQPDSGFNTFCAIVNGGQSDVTTINVDSGHTHIAGNKCYLLNDATSLYETRTISSISSTTIVLDQAVDVKDNDVVSNGLIVEVWRTKVGGSTFYLVERIPNNSLVESFTWADSIVDAELTVEWTTPPTDRSPPGSFKFLSLFRGTAVGLGFLTDVDQYSWSDWRNNIEYWPVDTNFDYVSTEKGDRGTAVFQNNEVCVIGKSGDQSKLGSIHVISGFLDELANFLWNVKTQSIGITSHTSVAEIQPGATAFCTAKGPYLQIEGNIPSSISDRIEPEFTDRLFSDKEVKLNRVVALNDAESERLLFFVPVEPNTAPAYATNDSTVWVYDYSKDPQLNTLGRWYQWNNMNCAGGLVKMGNNIYFSERRFSSYTNEVEHILYKIHNSRTVYDFADHNQAIVTRWASRYEDMEEPDIEKELTTLAILATTPTGNAYDLDVSLDLNYADGSASTSKTLSLTGDGTERKIFKTRDARHENFRLVIENSQIHKDILISGYEAQVHVTHDTVLEE